MDKKLKILIAEEHPIIIDAYKEAFNSIKSRFCSIELSLDIVANCEKACVKINEAIIKKSPYDLALIEINLRPNSNYSVLTGEDLGLILKKSFNDIKLIVFTEYNDNFRLYNILKNLNPDGFILKCNTTSDCLLKAIESVISNSTYYGATIVKMMRQTLTNDHTLDKIDRQILFHLSNGVNTKNLTNFIHLSLPGIVKRKSKLKDIFDIQSNDDTSLVKVAKEKGFI